MPKIGSINDFSKRGYSESCDFKALPYRSVTGTNEPFRYRSMTVTVSFFRLIIDNVNLDLVLGRGIFLNLN